MAAVKLKANLISISYRGLLFIVIWWILSDGTASSWWIALPAVIMALVVSSVLVSPMTIHWAELLGFVLFFLRFSLLGGIDVARRAFQPKIPIDPDFVEYHMQLPAGLLQVLMANTVSLLPGTLIAGLEESVIKVHVLDKNKDVSTELEMIEERIARIASIKFTPS